MTKGTRKRRAPNLSGEAKLFASLGSIASSQNSAEAAMQQCLTAVCEYVGWPVGHLYVNTYDGSGELAPAETWHLDDPERVVKYREVTSQTRFASGEGLPGRVLELGEPVWISDVQKDANFPRNKFAENILVHAAFAVPVEVAGRITAVLEFFAAEVLEQDERVLEVAGVLGRQIGQILERQRTSEELLKVREVAEAEVRAQLAEEMRVGEKLAEIGSLVSISNIADFYEQFVAKVRELIPCDRMVVSIIDHDADLSTLRYVVGDIETEGGAGAVSKYSSKPLAKIDSVDLPKAYYGKSIRDLARQDSEWQDRIEAGYVSALV
ncbi:MAG: GAF domain-containing protein, partial [Dehalococcoidia bacterium]